MTQAMNELEKLRNRFVLMGVTNFHVFRGDKLCTQEDLCAEINNALDQIEAMKAEEIHDD